MAIFCNEEWLAEIAARQSAEVGHTQVLRLMGQPPDTPLTPQIARELCERTGSTAVLNGTIATLGNQYVLGLRDRLPHGQCSR